MGFETIMWCAENDNRFDKTSDCSLLICECLKDYSDCSVKASKKDKYEQGLNSPYIIEQIITLTTTNALKCSDPYLLDELEKIR